MRCDMKKALALFLILALGSTMILTGCGSEPYDYDLTKYVKVGEYKGLEYKNPDKIKVSDKEIKDAIRDKYTLVGTYQLFKAIRLYQEKIISSEKESPMVIIRI